MGFNYPMSDEEREKRKTLGFYKEAVAELQSDSGLRLTKYKLRDWRPVYTKILVLYQKGMSAAQIAALGEIGFSVRQIKEIIEDPLFRLKLNQYSKKMDLAILEKANEEMTTFPEVILARDKLLESSEYAAKTLISLMRPRGGMAKKSVSERAQIANICMNILDRAGLVKLNTQDEGRARREFSPEEIKSAVENARELEQISRRLSGIGSEFVLGEKGADGTPASVETPERPYEEAESVAVETVGNPTERSEV